MNYIHPNNPGSSPENSHQSHTPSPARTCPSHSPSLHSHPSVSPPSSLPASTEILFLCRSCLYPPLSLLFMQIITNCANGPDNGIIPCLFFLSFCKPYRPINKHSHSVSLSHLPLLSIPLCLLLTHIYMLPNSIINQGMGGGREGSRELGDATTHTVVHFNTYCL